MGPDRVLSPLPGSCISFNLCFHLSERHDPNPISCARCKPQHQNPSFLLFPVFPKYSGHLVPTWFSWNSGETRQLSLAELRQEELFAHRHCCIPLQHLEIPSSRASGSPSPLTRSFFGIWFLHPSPQQEEPLLQGVFRRLSQSSLQPVGPGERIWWITIQQGLGVSSCCLHRGITCGHS